LIKIFNQRSCEVKDRLWIKLVQVRDLDKFKILLTIHQQQIMSLRRWK